VLTDEEFESGRLRVGDAGRWRGFVFHLHCMCGGWPTAHGKIMHGPLKKSRERKTLIWEPTGPTNQEIFALGLFYLRRHERAVKV